MSEVVEYENIGVALDDIAAFPPLTYPMDKKMGKSHIINLVASTHPGSMEDVKEMEKSCEMLGFEVVTYKDCAQKDMWDIRRDIIRDDTHKDSNCLMVTIISHGSSTEVFLATGGDRAWGLEDFISELDTEESLVGKPKIIIVQACRGSFESPGKSPSHHLADKDRPHSSILVADKADMFVGFATVPLYVAHAGDAKGSAFLQSFAWYLRKHYKDLPLDRIFMMVKQYVARAQNGKQCPEERSSLKYLLYFVMGPRRLIPTFSKDTRLNYWKGVRSARMPQTEDIVLWCQLSEGDPPRFHIYRGSARSWRLVGSVPGQCNHDNLKLLPLEIEGKEYLAVACIDCQNIRLMDVKCETSTSAFNDQRYSPGYMCAGNQGQMFVHVKGNGNIRILQLDCSGLQFKVIQIIQTNLKALYAICYIPVHNLIVVSDCALGSVTAICCSDKKEVWQLEGLVNSVRCRPHGMVYSNTHKVLLVADGSNCRIIILSPDDGTVRQVIDLRPGMGNISELSLLNKIVVIRHTESSKVHMSFYALE